MNYIEPDWTAIELLQLSKQIFLANNHHIINVRNQNCNAIFLKRGNIPVYGNSRILHLCNSIFEWMLWREMHGNRNIERDYFHFSIIFYIGNIQWFSRVVNESCWYWSLWCIACKNGKNPTFIFNHVTKNWIAFNHLFGIRFFLLLYY